MNDGFAIAAAAFAVILSAIVRLVRMDAAWKAVEEGYAGVEHVRDLTGIYDPRALQDVFGPPTMEGIYHIGRGEIMAARRITGWLMGDLRADTASIAIAGLALLWRPYGNVQMVLETALFLAVTYQVGGWIAASGLVHRRR